MFQFTLNATGPNAARQNASHAHEAILDPTGQFVVVPDLGADLVRIFSIDDETLKLTAETPLQVKAGDGPRHAVFYNPYSVVGAGSETYMFLVTELANTIYSYRVTYPKKGGLKFQQVYQVGTYGNLAVPVGNAAAEIAITVSLNHHLTRLQSRRKKIAVLWSIC